MGIKDTIKSLWVGERQRPQQDKSSEPHFEQDFRLDRTKERKLHNDYDLAFDGYANNGDVYAIVKMIASKSSEIDLNINKYFGGKKFLVEKGYVYDLIYNDLTESLDSKVFKMMLNLNLTGDVFLRKVKTVLDSKPSRLEVLRSASITIERDSNNEVKRYSYQDNLNNKYQYFEPEEVIHIMLYNPVRETGRGMSPLQAGYHSLMASNDLNIASESLLLNQGSSKLASTKKDSIMTPEVARQLQREVNKKVGGARKMGQLTVTSADVEVHDIGANAKDLELLATYPIKLRQLCTIFGVDSSFFNDHEAKTYNNRLEAEKSFINNAVKPNLEFVFKEIEREMRRYEDVYFELDYSNQDCLQEDQKLRAEKNTIVSNGIMSVLTAQIDDNKKAQILIDNWGFDKEKLKNYGL